MSCNHKAVFGRIALIILAMIPGLVCYNAACVIGSPRLITDNRVENLNGYPSIGRGYNLHSNTLQSVCFSKVTKTKPTFDLTYELDEITGEFFKEVPETGKERLGNINTHFFVKKYFKQQEVVEQKVRVLKNLLVRAVVRNYYYALDETNSTLSGSARKLLQNQEYVTFFNSCGQHYVRSVGSFSTYLALLQYRLTGRVKTDQAFVSRLEKGLFNFSGEKDVKTNFNEEAEARGMRVYVQAVGLAKGELVNLIPMDVNQFRLTVQDTVKLMQSPDAGLIRYIEVVPWMENPELTSLLTEKMKGGGEQFIKLKRLEANSGIITEINRMSNSQVEQFYIASMCEKILFEKYMDKSNRKFYENITGQTEKSPTVLLLSDIIEQKTLSYDMEKTRFYNLANISKENVYISLREFIEYFAKNPPNKLFDENKSYLYGDGKNPGAVHCIDELYKGGLEKVDYRTIPSCVRALKHMKSQSFFLSQYCLPKPAKLIFKEERENAPKQEQPEQRQIDSSIYGVPVEVDPKSESIMGEKPKSLEELVGEKVQPAESQKQSIPDQDETISGQDEKPTSLEDIRDNGSSGLKEPVTEELIELHEVEAETAAKSKSDKSTTNQKKRVKANRRDKNTKLSIEENNTTEKDKELIQVPSLEEYLDFEFENMETTEFGDTLTLDPEEE